MFNREVQYYNSKTGNPMYKFKGKRGSVLKRTIKRNARNPCTTGYRNLLRAHPNLQVAPEVIRLGFLFDYEKGTFRRVSALPSTALAEKIRSQTAARDISSLLAGSPRRPARPRPWRRRSRAQEQILTTEEEVMPSMQQIRAAARSTVSESAWNNAISVSKAVLSGNNATCEQEYWDLLGL